MLEGDFFTINSMEAEGSSVKVIIELNAGHDIYNGHFPGMPVVPGVCMMQMVKDIMERITGGPMQLAKADSMKFLVVVDPRDHQFLQMDLTYKTLEGNSVNVNANLSAGVDICFKFKGVFNL